MADNQSDQEKTEEPTLQRREEFRNQGQVAQTKELSSALMLFGFCLMAWFTGAYFLEGFSDIFRQLYGHFIPTVTATGDISAPLRFAMEKIIVLSMPVFLVTLVVGVSASLMQVGVLFTGEPLTPNINKINPLEGLKRLFSLRSLVEGLKAIAKFLLVGGTIFYIIYQKRSMIPALIYLEPIQILSFVAQLFLQLLLVVGILMLVMSAFDYFFQRFDLEKKMMMTKQEVKEENKQREGDPLVKARIRRVQKEIANRRMMDDVPKADVIITNPTHIAIALKYDPSKYASPIVVAKGVDFVAGKIRELAKENNIPIVENKPLARTIYKTLNIGDQVPRELFAAVAEVLAYVFKIKNRTLNYG